MHSNQELLVHGQAMQHKRKQQAAAAIQARWSKTNGKLRHNCTALLLL